MRAEYLLWMCSVIVPYDQQSNSSTQTRGERSQTDASSVDLEWEHEAGMLGGWRRCEMMMVNGWMPKTLIIFECQSGMGSLDFIL